MEQLATNGVIDLGPGAFDLDAEPRTLELLLGLRERHGDFCRIPSATRGNAGYVVHDVEAIRHVLLTNRSNYVKGVGLDRVRMLLGNGLIVSDGAFWQRQRRLMQPAFHSQVLRGFSALIHDQNAALIDRWAGRADTGDPINLSHDLSEVTLAIVLRALISTDLDRIVATQGRNPFELLSEAPTRDLAFAARFRTLVRVVREVISAREHEGRVEADWLSMLMLARDRDSGEGMSEKALIDELMTLIVAGHETTAATLNWTWVLLSRHPDVEALLHAGVDALPEQVTAEEAARQPWIEQLLSEVLRLYPPVWLFSRRALADDRLADHEIPAGSDIFIAPYLLHRHPAHWPDGEQFLPERFSERIQASRHRFAYLPFSAGPRHCIGERFALHEMALHLVMVARRFRLKYAALAAPVADFQINLRPREDTLMQVVARR